MAKRNQVTTDLRISADAQLKNSRSFMSQLDKIIDKFDFGDRINSQLSNAKIQLRDYNKILEKVQNKSLINEEELKDLTKAGREIANIIIKTEKLYSNLGNDELQKYSKERIASIKEQEAQIAKIKNDYANKTGKNFDKELAGYDKIVDKIKILKKEQDSLTKNGATSIATKEIEKLNQKLEEQKIKFSEIKKLQNNSSSVYSSTLDKESKKKGYENFNDIKNVKTQSEEQIRKNLGNNEYKKQSEIISEINAKIKDMSSSKKESNILDKEAISLAKKYKINDVNNLNSLKEQIRLKKEFLQQYKNDKGFLADEKLVTIELQRQNKIAEDKIQIEQKAKTAELTSIQKGGYQTKASLSASGSATNRNISSIEAQLSTDGIENITNTAAQLVASKLEKIQQEISKATQDLSSIDETNKKLSTQSERAADEMDVINSGKSTINELEKTTKEDGKQTRNIVISENGELKKQLITKESLTMGRDLETVLSGAPALESLSDLTPKDNQLTFTTQAASKQLKEVQDSYDMLIDDLKRKTEMLKSDLSPEEYEVIGNEGLKNLETAKNLVNDMTKIIKHSKAQEMSLLKQQQDEMTKHDKNGDKRFAGNNPILKNGYTIERYNELQSKITQLAKEYSQVDAVQTKLNVEFTQGENQLRNFNGVLKVHNQDIAESTNGNKNYSEIVLKTSNSISKAAEQSKYLGSAFDDLRNKVGYFLSMNYVFDQLVRKVKEATTFTKELDKDMVQIGLVLGQTAGKTWKNFDGYSKMADRLNTTVSDVTSSMKLFYQQGLNTVEVNRMVEASAIAAALGETSMAEASETLTSIINGYNLSANQAMNVTDKISMVAMVSAADFGELSIAIKKVASSAASAGLDLDHMMGYLGKMIETTREAPTNIGTALKTIVANFTQFKESPELIAQEGSDINKVDKALKSVGIQLLDATGDVRDLGEVLDELGKKWNSLNRSTKAYLATQIAGNRQQSRFYALMNDYDRTLELVGEANNSNGKATQQFALYQNSLTASTQRLNNEWEKFYNNILKNDSGLKMLSNSATGLLGIANKLGPVLTTLFGALLIKGTRSAFVHVSKVKDQIESLNQSILSTETLMERSLSGRKLFDGYSFAKTKNPNSPFSKLGEGITNSRFEKKGGKEQLDSLKNLRIAQDALLSGNEQLIKSNNLLNDGLVSQEEISNAIRGTVTAETKAKVADAVTTQAGTVAHTASTAVKWGEVAATLALNAALFLGIGIIAGLIAGGISLFKINHEQTIKMQEQAKAARENYDQLEELGKSYVKLSERVNITSQEKEELEQATQDLLEQYPELIAYIDSEGKAYAKTAEEIKKYMNAKESDTLTVEKNAAIKTLNDKHFKTNAVWEGFFGGIHKEDDDKMYGENQKSARDDLANTLQIIEDLGINSNSGYTTNDENGNRKSIDGAVESIQKEDYEELNTWIESQKRVSQERIDILEKEVNETSDLNNQSKKREEISKEKNKISSLEAVSTSATKYQVALRKDMEGLAEKIYSKSISDAGLNDDKESLAKNVLKQKTTTELSNKKGNEISEFLQSNEFNDLQNQVIERIKKLNNSEIVALEELQQEISTSTSLSFDQATQKIEKMKKTIPDATDLLDEQLKSYKQTIDSMTNNEDNKKNLQGLKVATINSLAQAKNGMQGDESVGFNEKEFNKIFSSALEQKDFLSELDSLDSENLAEIQQFKRKYSETLGKYGQEFIEEIVKNPKYDADKTQEKLSTAQAGMTTQNANGVNFNDISQGTVSQETAFKELTNESTNARRNITLVGNELMVTGKEITDSFLDSQIKAMDALQAIITQAETNINTYQKRLNELNTKGIDNLTESEKKEYNQINKNISAEKNRINISNDLAKAYSKVDISQKAINDNQEVITGFSAVKKEIDALKDLADMYQYVGNARMSQLDIIDAVMQNTDLLMALEVNEQGQLELNKNGIEAVASAKIGEAKATVDAQIAKLEAMKGYIEADGVYTQQDIQNISSRAEQWINGSTDQQTALVNEETAMQSNLTATEKWALGLKSWLSKAVQWWNNLWKSSEGQEQTIEGSGTTTNVKQTSVVDFEGKTTITGQEALGKIQSQIDKLKSVSGTLSKYQSNPGKLLGDINKMGDYTSSDGGSKDKFDAMIEKLDKFYNYMRQLETLEAKINKLREKRNLIDATKNYYIEDLKEENKLLEQQAGIYGRYINDQTSYLADLRSSIASTYGDWAYFNNEGVVQVKQTDFNINSEAEKERYESFSELLQEYESQYKTMLENQNKLYEIQSTIVDNIKSQYDKILARVTDVTDELQRQADLLEHDITMSFSNIAKFDIMDDQLTAAMQGIKTAQSYLNGFESDIKSLNDQIKNGPFAELMQYDEALQMWRTNEEKLNDSNIVSKYEKMGYTWSEIQAYTKSVAAKSEAIRNSWKETEDSLNGFLESMKQLIDDRISAIQDFFGASTDEFTKIFDTFDRKVSNIDNETNLFGASADQLEDKYLTLVTATAVLKQTIAQLKDNRGSILDTIKKDYPEYIAVINGVSVVNKQAIEESTKLTQEQKAELLQLYGIYEASGEQIDGLEDKLMDYFNTMMEMEQAKRDAIIDLKQQVHDELMSRDQEEIDDLRSKYDKMSQLDSEYYNKLQERVNDARNLRQDRQTQNNINQMQARLAVLQTSSDTSYNSELIELQKQLNEALQAQADNDITRELERIAREQKEREEDRQMELTAMENVLTFKDDNNWYWQEAERIWAEGPESVIGWLSSSREMMNTSDENRALLFENLNTQMNTAFTTLQTAAGESDRLSDGVVTSKSDEEQLKLDGINSSLGVVDDSVNAVKDKIDWTNAEAMKNAVNNASNIMANAGMIKDKMFEFYKSDIKPGTTAIYDRIKQYLGEDSKLITATDLNGKKIDLLKQDINSQIGSNIANIVNSTNSIVSTLIKAKEEYVASVDRVYKWLDDTYRKEHAGSAGSNGNGNSTPPSAGGSGNAGSSNSGGASGGAPNLAKGSSISVKPGTKWYYDSYGTSPSGTARGGKITYTNLKAPYAYNIEGLGWIKKSDIVGYSKGGYVDYTGVANVHGSQTDPEAFLNSKQTRLFENLRDGLVKRSTNSVVNDKDDEITKEEYNFGDVRIEVKEIADIDAVDKFVNKVKTQIYKDSIGGNNMAVRRR